MKQWNLLLTIIPPFLTSTGLPPRPVQASPPPTRPSGRDRPHTYQIISDQLRYSGWRRIIRRTVQRPSHPPIEFDIIDQHLGSDGAVMIFAWNSTSRTATMIREYMPGCHRVLHGLAAGVAEVGKHDGEDRNLVAARCELEEECHLGGGTWYRLTEEGISVPMDKYVATEITPYLVVDPHLIRNPQPHDDEEDIEIVSGVTPEEIMSMIRGGDMNLVGGWGALLALEKLRELGEI